MPNCRPPDLPASVAGLFGKAGPPTTALTERSYGGVESVSAVEVCDGGADPCCGPVYVAENTEFGKAAWYDFVGSKTANGETLDTVTATAAHRSLPLASFAKVIDLDNGRSVIVKINDRGPYTRGRIIDLSPRAADALKMKSAGVANVVIEPLLKQAAPTLAAFQTVGAIEAP